MPLGAGTFRILGMGEVLIRAQGDGYLGRKGGRFGMFSLPSGSGQSPLTTKGDVWTYSTGDARLGVGADGTIFMADAAAATGNKWATPAQVRSALSLATVASSGAYADLSGTPTLATVATSGSYADLSGRPTLAAVATSGAYSDLTGTPPAAPVMTHGAITTTSTSSNTTWTAITGSEVSITSGSTYYIRWMLSAYAAAATTGHRTRRVLAGGGAGNVLAFHTIAQSAAAATVGHSSREGTNDFSPGTGGATSTTTAKGLVLVECVIECTASGTIGLELQSEVSASAVTIDGDGSAWVALRQ